MSRRGAPAASPAAARAPRLDTALRVGLLHHNAAPTGVNQYPVTFTQSVRRVRNKNVFVFDLELTPDLFSALKPYSSNLRSEMTETFGWQFNEIRVFFDTTRRMAHSSLHVSLSGADNENVPLDAKIVLDELWRTLQPFMLDAVGPGHRLTLDMTSVSGGLPNYHLHVVHS